MPLLLRGARQVGKTYIIEEFGKQIFMEEKKLPLGVQISAGILTYRNNILTIPFYLISQLPRLVQSILGQKKKDSYSA